MKRKQKWIISIALVLIIFFVPVPIFRFVDFVSVYSVDEQNVNVGIKTCFIQFKSLFFYGIYGEERAYFPFGHITLYDNSTDEKICNLKLNTSAAVTTSSDKEKVYIAPVFQYDEHTFTTYVGSFVWNDSCDTIALGINAHVLDPVENQVTVNDFHYMASKQDLTREEILELFEFEKGVFLPSSMN